MPYLPTEANPIRGLEKLAIDVVGSLDDGGNSILVLWGGDGQQGKGSQGNVVLAGTEAALVVAVGVQAEDRGPRNGWHGPWGSLHHAQLQKNLRTQEKSIEANHMGQRGTKMRTLSYADPIYASPCQPVVWHSHAVCQEPKDIPVLKGLIS